MSEDNDGLKFSNFDLTDNHEDDNQKENNHNNYNLISQITNVENFEFEFEPDEENEENTKNRQSLKNDTETYNSNDIAGDNIEVNNIESNDYIQSKEFENELLINSSPESNITILPNKTSEVGEFEISEDEAEDILAQVLAQDFTTPVAGFEEFGERKKIREEAGKILDGDNFQKIEVDYDFNKDNDRYQKTEENLQKNNAYNDNILDEIDESDIDEELNFSDIADININNNINNELLNENKENNNFNLENDEELHVDYNDLEYFEEIHNIEDDELDFDLTSEEDFDILDFNDSNKSEESKFEFEKINVPKENNVEELYDNSNNVINDNDTKNEFDLYNLIDIEDLDENLEFDFEGLNDLNDEDFNLDISNNDIEEELEDDFDLDHIQALTEQNEDYVGNIDDEGFNLDLGNGDEENKIEEDFDVEDVEIFSEQNEDYDGSLDDEGFNLDLGNGDTEEELEEDFDIEDIEIFSEQNEDYDGSLDDEGFNLDLGNGDTEEELEEDFDLEDFDNFNEFNDNDSITIDDDGFDLDFDNDENKFDNDDFDDFNFNDEDSLDDFDEEYLLDEDIDDNINDKKNDVLSDYEKNELTVKTQQHLLKIRTVIKNIPKNTKDFTANTVAFLKRLNEIRNEIKEEGVNKTLRKYFNHSKNTLSRSAATVGKKLHENIKKKSLNLPNKSKQNIKNKKKTELDGWTGDDVEDTWGLGPAISEKINDESEQKLSNLSSENGTEEDEADWDEEEISFSTADMLMEDAELGLEEFGDFGKNKKEELEDTTDYSGLLGKVKKVKKITYKWLRLIYKFLDSIIDFEKNWWKVVDFLAVVMLMIALAMVVAYYIWHK